MLVVISKYTATLDGGGTVAFAVASNNLASAANHAPGCHRFDVCSSLGINGDFAHIQYYDGQAAYEAHKKSGPFKAFTKRVAGVVTDRSEDIFTLAYSPTGP